MRGQEFAEHLASQVFVVDDYSPYLFSFIADHYASSFTSIGRLIATRKRPASVVVAKLA